MKPCRNAIQLLLSAILVLLITGCISSKKQINPEGDIAIIKDIQVNDQVGATEIRVVADRPMIYTSYELDDPQRLILDLAKTSTGAYKEKIRVETAGVIAIEPIEGKSPGYVARLEITLTESTPYEVRAEGLEVIILIEKPVGGEPEDAMMTDPGGVVEPPLSGTVAVPVEPVIAEELIADSKEEGSRDIIEIPLAETVSKITYDLDPNRVIILVSADGRLQPKAFMVGGNRLVVDLPNVKSLVRPNRIPIKHKLIKRIRVGQHVNPVKMRVVFDLQGDVSYTVNPTGSDLEVELMASGIEDVSETTPPVILGDKVRSEGKSEAQKQEKPAEALAEAKERVSDVKETPPEKILPAGEFISKQKFTGRKISLDFQDAEITNILRLLADVSGDNMVIADAVKGKITLKLINVPWDQSLDIILKMRGLGQVREGNIIRIDSMANIIKQRDAEARARETQVRAEVLITKVIRVNYAEADVLSESLVKSLSPRGDITIDERTNTMIVKDIRSSINEILELVKTLDTRPPQVLIEARIVQADTSFARSLGIQWGLGFQHIDSNNIAQVQGINTSSLAQPGFGLFAPDFAVNLPGTVSGLSAVPSVGFNFGRFTDNPINLDLRLSAGELNGLTKTVSSPKITTMDNVTAKIEQGESIPFQTTSQKGTRTQFVDANLTLEVTPHITADRSIIMKVKVARNALGSFSGPAGPSISKREANTEVLVRNGETTVIGGIFVDETTDTEASVPFLSKIPILGWLFKSETKIDTKNELLIFLTPTIVD